MAIGVPTLLVHPAPLTGSRTTYTATIGAVPAGSLVIAQFGIHHTTGVAAKPGSCVDSNGNTFLSAIGVGRSSSNINTSTWFFFYPTGAPDGTTVTLSNFNSTSATGDICWFGAWSVSGMAATSTLDQTKSAASSSSSPSTGASSATGQADELLWPSLIDGSTSSITQTWPPTTPAGMSSLVNDEQSGAYGWSVAYKILGATGAQTVSTSLSGTDDWAIALSTFKASANVAYFLSGSGGLEICSQSTSTLTSAIIKSVAFVTGGEIASVAGIPLASITKVAGVAV